MPHYRSTNIAFRARWHRQLANDLTRIGDDISASDHLERALLLENELVANRQCRACGRRLKDDESLDTGYGPECRRKLSGLI